MVGAAIGSAGATADRRRRLVRAATDIGLALSDPTIDCLLDHLALLAKWNRVYNLTAVRDPDEMLALHLIDCLAVVPAMRRHAVGRRLRILDVGSGGGLPGAVLAAVNPDWDITCVDTVDKKARFIRQAAAELGLTARLHAVHARVEAMPEPGGFDVIVSRAFASLADFTRLTAGQLSAGGVWLAMKGKPPADEQAALPPGITVFHVELLQVPDVAAERCLVWMRPGEA